MGLFCLPQGDRSGDLVKCAMGDLDLFLGDWEHKHDMRCSNNYPNDYLLVGAINLLKDALDKYREECDNNPNINAPLPPDPLIDIELALEHAKGDEVDDCTALLCFFNQHPDQANELLGRVDPAVQSQLGVTAILRYTWQDQDELPNWKKLINTAWKFYENEDRESLFMGLTKFVDK